MTTNESAPNVPQPIDSASQIALAVLARFFDERQTHFAALAEGLRADYPIEFSEQQSIAYTWECAANATWELLGGRTDADKYVRRVHTVAMDLRELGKLIAMATAPRESPANECSNSERTQYELTINRIQGVTVKAHQALDKYGIQAWGDDHQLELHERIELTIAELQARIAELTKMPVVDGAAALQRVRDAIKRCPVANGRIHGAGNIVDNLYYGTDVIQAIDEAIAALAPIANNELAVHEFVCNESMTRGAYFLAGDVRGCIAFNGSTMGFEYIPAQLGLAPGDVIEIRVIERADR